MYSVKPFIGKFHTNFSKFNVGGAVFVVKIFFIKLTPTRKAIESRWCENNSKMKTFKFLTLTCRSKSSDILSPYIAVKRYYTVQNQFKTKEFQ